MTVLGDAVGKCGGITELAQLGKGVLLRGDSGKGKTRIMWRIMRLHFDAGKSIKSYTAGAFERACRDAAGEFELTDWFESLASADCVFIDDLGKSPWSPATTSTFFDLLESRSSSGRPMYVTTNLSGDSLLRQLKLEKDIGEPMLRRLREFCELHTI
jgi:DNA replication protein DnaC